MYKWVKFISFKGCRIVSTTHRKSRRSPVLFDLSRLVRRRNAIRHTQPYSDWVQTPSLGCPEAYAYEVWNTSCSHIRSAKMVCRRDKSVFTTHGLKSRTHYGSTRAFDSKLIVGRYIGYWSSSCWRVGSAEGTNSAACARSFGFVDRRVRWRPTATNWEQPHLCWNLQLEFFSFRSRVCYQMDQYNSPASTRYGHLQCRCSLTALHSINENDWRRRTTLESEFSGAFPFTKSPCSRTTSTTSWSGCTYHLHHLLTLRNRWPFKRASHYTIRMEGSRHVKISAHDGRARFTEAIRSIPTTG